MTAAALAQQSDPAKLAPVYRQQRDLANDQIANCAVSLADLQAKIADLEKQLAAAKAEQQ
jgi:phage shock protein A